MIKRIAWNAFKKTGDINTFLEFKQLKDIEENIGANNYGDYKDKGNSNIRK